MPDYAGTVEFTSSDPSRCSPPTSTSRARGQVTVPRTAWSFGPTDQLVNHRRHFGWQQHGFPFQVSPPAVVTAAVEELRERSTFWAMPRARFGLTQPDRRRHRTPSHESGDRRPRLTIRDRRFSSVKVIGGTGPFSLAIAAGLASPLDPVKGGIQFFGGPSANTLSPRTKQTSGRSQASTAARSTRPMRSPASRPDRQRWRRYLQLRGPELGVRRDPGRIRRHYARRWHRYPELDEQRPGHRQHHDRGGYDRGGTQRDDLEPADRRRRPPHRRLHRGLGSISMSAPSITT